MTAYLPGTRRDPHPLVTAPRGRVSNHRGKASVVVFGAVLAATLAGCSMGATDPITIPQPARADVVAGADSSSAISLLATLPIKGRAPMTGYLRTAMFGAAWIDRDHNGCDTRNDILVRDLTGLTKSGTCRVLSGPLLSPYTGQTIAFVRGNLTSTAVQIDHVVSLGDAWRSGATAMQLPGFPHPNRFGARM